MQLEAVYIALRSEYSPDASLNSNPNYANPSAYIHYA